VARGARGRTEGARFGRVSVGVAASCHVNVVIGNADAHSKNYSAMIDRDGSVSLAPIYDAASVMYLAPAFKTLVM
jgi:hypothetical protein